MSEREQNSDFNFEIVEKIGIINSFPTGWNREINLVSWNGGQAKYDIRDWDHSHEHMSKGVRLHAGEMRKMLRLLADRDELKDTRAADAGSAAQSGPVNQI